MATDATRVRTSFGSYAWMVFAGLGGLLILLGAGDFFRQGTSLFRENSLNEVLIGLFGVVIGQLNSTLSSLLDLAAGFVLLPLS